MLILAFVAVFFEKINFWGCFQGPPVLRHQKETLFWGCAPVDMGQALVFWCGLSGSESWLLLGLSTICAAVGGKDRRSFQRCFKFQPAALQRTLL